MDELIATDLPTATLLLSDVNTTLKDVTASVQNLLEKLKNEEYNTNKGFSLLELKNHTFMTYLMNLVYVSMRKFEGSSIENESCIERLVEARVSLERLRPLEDKIKYQIEKYTKIAKEGLPKDDDPSQLTGDLENIVMSSSDEDDAASSKDGLQDATYKIPKISQTHYPDEEADKDKHKEREKKRALNSAMLQDALSEYTDDPTVIHNSDILKERAIRKRKEIERYEEENMTRITLTKKQKSELGHMSTMGNMKREFLSFHSLDALDPNAKISKSHKSGGSKSKLKGKGKKRKGSKRR